MRKGTMTMIMTVAMLALMALVGSVGISGAEETTPVAIAPTENLLDFAGLNIAGDVAYLANVGFAKGFGMDVVSFKKGLVTLRGEALWPDNTEKTKESVIGGAGLMLDVIKAVKSSDFEWKLGPINPKLGPFGGYDFGGRKFRVGAVLQILRIDF